MARFELIIDDGEISGPYYANVDFTEYIANSTVELEMSFAGKTEAEAKANAVKAAHELIADLQMLIASHSPEPAEEQKAASEKCMAEASGFQF